MEAYLGVLSTVIPSPIGETNEKANVALTEETIHYRHHRHTHIRKQQIRNKNMQRTREWKTPEKVKTNYSYHESMRVCGGGWGVGSKVEKFNEIVP